MSYMKRAFELIRSGVSEAEAARIVATERLGEAELCQWADERCDEPRDHGTHFCAVHIGPMRVRASADACCADDSDASGTKEAA